MKIAKRDLQTKAFFALMYFVFMLSEGISVGSPLYSLSVSVENFKLKYFLLVLGIGYYLFSLVNNRKTLPMFREETKTIILMVLILGTITVLKQLRNGFMSTSYNELFFLTAPLLYVFFVVNNRKNDIKGLINIAFVIQCIIFLLNIFSKISIQSIRSINFLESYSPFESEHSFYALIFFVFYLYNNDRIRTFISFAMCFLAFKRLSVVFCILLFVLKALGKDSFFHGTVKKRTVLVFTVLYTLIPILYSGVLSTGFQRWFFSVTNIDFSYLLTGRTYRTQLCIENPMLYGLGSTTEFLTKTLPGSINRNLHNDLLRIYLECGVIGSIALAYSYFKSCSKSRISTILMIYLFSDMLFNHFLGAGRTAFWILIYFVLYYYNAEFALISEKGIGSNENRYSNISQSL